MKLSDIIAQYKLSAEFLQSMAFMFLPPETIKAASEYQYQAVKLTELVKYWFPDISFKQVDAALIGLGLNPKYLYYRLSANDMEDKMVQVFMEALRGPK